MNTLAPAPSADDLSDAERQLLRAAASGQSVDLRSGNAELDNPARASEWGDGRIIRAEFLTELLTGDRAPASGRLRAIRMRGARVTGPLGLEARTLLCPLALWDCALEEAPDLSGATAMTIMLPGCHLPALNGERLRTSGNLELNKGFSASGRVNLYGAHIGGQLDLSGATLANNAGEALTADGLIVDQGMFCRDRFTAHGGVRLTGAHISGELSLNGAFLSNENGNALTADRLTVEQGLFCQDGFTARGEIRLLGAHIGGVLSLNDADLINKNGNALTADGLTVEQSMFCRDRFTAQGGVRLLGAHIGGTLSLNGAKLTKVNGEALNADRLTVDHGMFCRDGFTAQGEIRLLNVHIGGQLDLSGAKLNNENGTCLNADGLTVDHGMFCRDEFTAYGKVRLHGAHIGGQLDLSGAKLNNENSTALNAERLTVDRNMFCTDGFTAHGEMRLDGAHIAGQLDLSDAQLSNKNGNALAGGGLTVDEDVFCQGGFTACGGICLLGARIGGALILHGACLVGTSRVALDLERATMATLALLPKGRPDWEASLTNAHVGVFYDDPATWPATISLQGFVYDSLQNDRASVRKRLGWLARDPAGFTPQVYDQLASAYRRVGHEGRARRVAITKQWRSRNRWNPLNWLMYATVGYGYRNWVAAVWLAALTVIGTCVFRRPEMIAATAHPQPFQSTVYTLDVLLPVVDFGQQASWQPHGATLYLSWALIGAGWILTTAVLAGLAGFLQRD